MATLIAENWISTLRNHRFPTLFPSQPINIKITTENFDVIFELSKDRIELLQEESEIHCQIEGPVKIIEQIVFGEILLQDAVKQEHIKITGSYRTILLLESIFWLNRKHSELAK